MTVYFSYLDIMIDTFGSIGAVKTTENADLPTETKNQIPGMAALRAFRVLRALKAISVIPGLKVRIRYIDVLYRTDLISNPM